MKQFPRRKPARPAVVSVVSVLAAGVAAAFPSLSVAQTKPPIATYWMSVETTSGLPMGGPGGSPSMMDMGRMMLGGGANSTQRQITLQLGSQQAAGGAPSAEHVIPPGLKMGNALPLETPRRVPAEKPEEPRQLPFERPKGRILLFWGCGDKAGPGQPLVIDFSKLAAGQWPEGLFSRRVSMQQPPSFGRSKTYGDWPNERDSTRVPADGRLAGEHVIKGNYSPQIRFTLADTHDFMDPVVLATTKVAGGATALRWSSVSTALGYFAMFMGGSKQGAEELVWWSSSAVKGFGGEMIDFLPPAEIPKLIRERIVMPPSTTECTVPAEVMAAAPAGMLQFVAYGNEANFAYPPRPQDPKAPWNPEWVTKVRLKSTANTMIGEGMPGGGTAGAGGGAGEPQDGGDPLKQGVNKLKGLFGF